MIFDINICPVVTSEATGMDTEQNIGFTRLNAEKTYEQRPWRQARSTVCCVPWCRFGSCAAASPSVFVLPRPRSIAVSGAALGVPLSGVLGLRLGIGYAVTTLAVTDFSLQKRHKHVMAAMQACVVTKLVDSCKKKMDLNRNEPVEFRQHKSR